MEAAYAFTYIVSDRLLAAPENAGSNAVPHLGNDINSQRWITMGDRPHESAPYVHIGQLSFGGEDLDRLLAHPCCMHWC
jgi:hypothetical protein